MNFQLQIVSQFVHLKIKALPISRKTSAKNHHLILSHRNGQLTLSANLSTADHTKAHKTRNTMHRSQPRWGGKKPSFRMNPKSFTPGPPRPQNKAAQARTRKRELAIRQCGKLDAAATAVF